ncbi:trypsin-like serine protease [Hymenobacter metallicola]|uniref:Trypsin-like serine protease n=1 Tax=Hymenobacter metallicola TaxID=2563114 RepID=A0A4Z0QE58_9BACT|nr:trypsin-like serine protease [Hymenobacter metallicola]TGE27301.1 trypsin-like serine protease [Hymenobacter metallicola]
MKFFTFVVLWCLLAVQAVAQDFISQSAEEPNKALIIGGQPIAISQAPWTVSVKSNLHSNPNYQPIGGGSIVEPRWILTSASALIGQSAANLQIRAGATDQATGGQLVQVAQIIRHPGFNASTFENDIALLQLSTPLLFNADVKLIKYASPATLPDNLMNAGVSASLLGWGATVDGSYTVTNQLRKADMSIISNLDANNRNQGNVPFPGPPVPLVSANMIAVFQSGKGAGNLDGGGPMVIYNGTEPVLAGCSSWSRDPRDQYPSICTRIKNYASWLQGLLPAPLTVSVSSNVVPQLDDAVRVDFYAGGLGGVPPYTYLWTADIRTGTGPWGISRNGGSQFSISGGHPDNADQICAIVRVTDASNQVIEARSCGNQAETSRTAITTYPNPADTYLEIRTAEAAQKTTRRTATTPVAQAHINLYDAQGVLKYSGTTQNGLLKLDSSTLPQGIYHLQLSQGNAVSTRQIVIRH